MSAVPPSPLALLATGLGCVTAALGGCGASEPESVGAEALQSRLVSVADRVDACFAKTNDARKCTDASAL
ncbi:MAG: hypothetical protein JHD16_19130, partial [Solirubrobacteraceae bacterium]|nr:hypothetical protein [Solirubrobacteraceae bacterium]